MNFRDLLSKESACVEKNSRNFLKVRRKSERYNECIDTEHK